MCTMSLMRFIRVALLLMCVLAALINCLIYYRGYSKKVKSGKARRPPAIVDEPLNISSQLGATGRKLIASPDAKKSYYELYYGDEVNSRIVKVDTDYDAVFAPYLQPLSNQSELYAKWAAEYNMSVGRVRPPLNFEKWIEFAKRKSCPIHPHYYYQIEKDLAPFRQLGKKRPITFGMLHEASDLSRQRHIVEINDTQIMVDGKQKRRLGVITGQLMRILPRNKRIMFILNHHDNPAVLVSDENYESKYDKYPLYHTTGNKCIVKAYRRYVDSVGYFMNLQFHANHNYLRTSKLLPVFSSCKTICHSDILMPFKTITTEKPINDTVPWQNKSDKMLWRGGTTGSGWGMYSMSENVNYRQLPRIRLNKWAQMAVERGTMPIEIDIGFTATSHCYEKLCRHIRRTYTFKEFMTYEDHARAKYLLAIDGHTWPSRLRPFLFGHSLVFLSTVFVEWFSFLARPWHHYVPIDMNLGDMEENILKAHANDDEARQIGERASRMAKKHLNYEGMQCYTGLLLLEYTQLLNLGNSSQKKRNFFFNY